MFITCSKFILCSFFISMADYFLCLSESRSKFQDTVPIKYTVYRYRKIYYFQYSFNL